MENPQEASTAVHMSLLSVNSGEGLKVVSVPPVSIVLKSRCSLHSSKIHVDSLGEVWEDDPHHLLVQRGKGCKERDLKRFF